MKRFTALFLCLIFILGAAMSCSDNSGIEQQDSANISSDSDTETDILAHLPEKHFDDTDFTILCYQTTETEYSIGEESADVIEDALYKRDRAVEEAYGVKLNYIIYPETDVDRMMANVVTAEDDTYDMFIQRAYRIGSAMLDRNFLDWSEIPHIDFTKPWWIADAIDKYNIGTSKYIAAGDMMATTITYGYGMYFNKSLVETNNIENPYQVVHDDRWTIDYLITAIHDLSDDLNGDTVFTFDDLYGFTTDNFTCIDAFTGAFDVPIIGRNSENMPVLTYGDHADKMQIVTEKLCALYWDGNGAYVWKDLNNPNTHVKLFANNRAVFMATPLRDLLNQQMRDMDKDYGILPYPKYDENQEEYTAFTLDGFGVQLIPYNVASSKYEKIGIIAEALNAKSYQILRPALYEIALKVKTTRDETSEQMLDIIMNGRRYDLASIYASEINYWWMLRELVSANNTNFASTYRSREQKALKVIENITDLSTGDSE